MGRFDDAMGRMGKILINDYPEYMEKDNIKELLDKL